MRTLLLALALMGCNKHDVPQGGQCDAPEDCSTFNFACVKFDQLPHKVCTSSCSDLKGVTSGLTCSAGFTCQRFDEPHRILGHAYCAPPGAGKQL